MAEAKNISLKTCLAPLPDTERGYGVHISADPKRNRIAYGHSRFVVVRSLEDPSQSDLFIEHKSRVTVAKFSPNGEWICSGDDTGRVLVWGVTNKIIKLEQKVGRRVYDIDWSSDGQRIVVVGDGGDTKARVFAWDSGNSFGQIMGHTKTILSCAFKPSRPFRIATCAEDNCVHFYEGPPFKFTSKFDGHTRYPNAVRYSPDGNFFASVGADCKIFVFDGKTGDKVRDIESKDGHKGAIYSFCFSPDGKQILTASADKTAKIWDFESGEVVKTFVIGADVGSMQVGTIWCNQFVISVSLNGTLTYLDIDNVEQRKLVVQGHREAINDMVMLSDVELYSGDCKGVLTHWNLTKGEARWFTGKGHGDKPIQNIALTPNALISTGADGTVKLNDMKLNAFNDSSIVVDGMPSALAVSSTDSDLFVVGVAQQKLFVVRKGTIVSQLDIQYKPTCADIADNEVAVGGEDSKIHIYSLDGDNLVEKEVVDNLGGQLTWLVYSPDGAFLASSDKARCIHIRERANGFAAKNPFGWKYHTAKVTHVAWSPSGSRLMSVSQDQNIFIWNDLQSYSGDQKIKFGLAHSGGITLCKFLDENTIVTVGDDRCIKIWTIPSL